jgi:hypothetical protein
MGCKLLFLLYFFYYIHTSLPLPSLRHTPLVFSADDTTRTNLEGEGEAEVVIC